MVRLRRSILVSLSITVAAIAAPGLARAATVEVVVDQISHKIVFAGGSEANTVTVALVGQPGNPNNYAVTDASSPIVAGAGCSGGGPAGSSAVCSLPRSAAACAIRGCPPGPPVSPGVEINLGEGDDSLDSTGMPSGDGGSGSFTIRGNGGPGADTFVDGPASVGFDPGIGADIVNAGDGYDSVAASAGVPDEADVYDLGAAVGPYDSINYRAASYAVTVSLDGIANDGAPGEGDQVLGAEGVAGGTANDVLIGASDADVPIGASDAHDSLRGFGGDDLIIGGTGDDLLTGGSGNDTIQGGSGDDPIHGDGGDDVLSGGAGNDFVQGYRGRDRLRGGFGSDLLLGATSVTRDGDVDRLNCGPADDRRAYVGPEDIVRRCEGTQGSR